VGRFGEEYARMLLIFSMTMMYSVSCPLITPFGNCFLTAWILPILSGSEFVLLNVYGAPKLILRNEFRQPM
jgi:hypothetical protein